MKKILFYFGLLGIVFASCNQENNTNTPEKNALLPENILVRSEVNFKDTDFEDWTKGVDKSFFSHLITDVLNSDIETYDAWLYPDLPYLSEISENDIKASLAKIPKHNFKSLLFTEKWSFDKKAFRFEKEPLVWTPILSYQVQVKDTVQERKKVIFSVQNIPNKAETRIAKDIIYEVDLSDNTNYKFLDLEKTAHLLLDSTLTGKHTISDFFTGEPLELAVVKRNLGMVSDTMDVENLETGEIEQKLITSEPNFQAIRSYIFKEDWYFDNQTKSIRKEVKAICPILLSIDEDVDGIEFTRKKPIGFIKMN